MKTGTGTILIVEDDRNDVEFLRRAFRKAGAENPVQVVSNGEEAVAYLSGHGSFADRAVFPFPRVIMSDLKMPRMGGLELLKWIHENPKFRVVPTLIFTASDSHADIAAAYEYGAAGYVVKPVGFQDLERYARIIVDYWRIAELPF